MKQVVKKSVGAAVLGAAFAAAGAGTAAAAPIGVLGPVGAVATGAAGDLPVKDATRSLPGGLSETATAGHEIATGGRTTHDLDKPLNSGSKVGDSAPDDSLLGGLPLG
ncbi:hypothetical protein [Streptomyces iconiensis]|uniref:ATP-binding protein n=1 Tax=Streptomyces iconiensis TaxID=1384038 RepID=A0ABT7AAC1_9ACTN|nr:hypothetical protein [Streptomyces iconiensis]MDJ1137997.1 hypothetical protein [Streptomyces iconiensis]